MAELLLEVLSEEIPARMQARASDDLKRLVCDGLKAAGLDFTDARAFATPRRLALVVEGLPVARADVSEEKRGPRVGAPDQAVQGFLKGAGLASLDQAEKRDTGKGEFWFAVVTKKGGPTADALPGIIDAAMKALPWPKSMKWGSGTMQWVRPLQGIVALFDGKVLAGEVAPGGKMAPIPFGDTTRGHRFLSKGWIKVTGFADYEAKLKAAHVILDPAERKKIILDGAQKLCAAAGVSLKSDDGLMDEVAGLVEWPVPLLGTIDPAFMDVPAEVLIVSMKTHQRYFATTKADGTLANRFVVVANNVARDGGAVIVDGNERVLRARLSDAKFFWDQDIKVKLEDRLTVLKGIVFHAKLGTQAERVERITKLAIELTNSISNADVRQVEWAARLCKADLVTGIVGEFPELQGTMGRYLAQNEKLPEAVVQAIGDQYFPAGPSDSCPSAPVSIVVAIAEKLDTLGALWSVGERPTGSRDPYALRRAAIGILRILVENDIRVDLTLPLFQAIVNPRLATINAEWQAVLKSLKEVAEKTGPNISLLLAISELKPPLDTDHTVNGIIAPKLFEEMIEELSGLKAFVRERIRVQALDRGLRSDIVNAIIEIPGSFDPIRFFNLARELEGLIASADGKNLLMAYTRATNILRQEEKKDKGLSQKIAGPLDPELWEQDEEKAVAWSLANVRRAVQTDLELERFATVVKALASLRGPIDAFFDKVTVNVANKPDVRLNRLKLLNQIRATMDSVADFSRIES